MREKHPGRLILVAGFAALVILWMSIQVRSARELEAWRDVERRGPRAVLSGEIPDIASALLARARARTENAFPPDREGAIADLNRALEGEPLRSGTWILLARQQLFLGRADEGRAALEFSDSLDPWFPRQRLRSAQLWTLLGERERATDLARSVASLGESHRLDAARRLMEMAYPAGDVYTMVGGDELDAEGSAALMAAIEPANVADARGLFAGLNPKHLDDPSYRAAYLARALNPYLHEEVVRAWMAEEEVKRASAAGIVYTNEELDRGAFAGDFPLGWQRAPERASFGAAWAAAGIVGDAAGGALRITFPQALREEQTGFNYRIYRFPTTGGEPFRVVMRVRSNLESGTRAWLALRVSGESLRGQPVPLTSEWQEVVIIADQLEGEGIVDLFLAASHDRRSLLDQPELYVDAISFTAAEEVAP